MDTTITRGQQRALRRKHHKTNQQRVKFALFLKILFKQLNKESNNEDFLNEVQKIVKETIKMDRNRKQSNSHFFQTIERELRDLVRTRPYGPLASCIVKKKGNRPRSNLILTLFSILLFFSKGRRSPLEARSQINAILPIQEL